MKITIITLFPQMFSGPFDYSIVKRAIDKKQIELVFVDIRDFGEGKHKIVDDKPYGGGVGMVLKVDVLKKALDSVLDKRIQAKDQMVVLMSASGEKYKQKTAVEYSKLKHLIIICGHYEGVDERIKKYIDNEISIGDFVLTGGEIPAMLLADSITRLLPGVIADGATTSESFSNQNLLEHPQFTRPASFEGKSVPSILISGNHAKISEWKNEEGLRKTKVNRKDLNQTKKGS